jgi:hypothetical protein
MFIPDPRSGLFSIPDLSQIYPRSEFFSIPDLGSRGKKHRIPEDLNTVMSI